MSDSYIIYGARASYFTQKMLGIFRYKEIPHEYRQKTLFISGEIEKAAGTRLIPVVKTPDQDYIFDTTPIALEMDKIFPGSDLLPSEAVPRITARIIEDFLDEWFTRFVMNFRWFHAADCEHSGDSIARDLIGVELDTKLMPEQKTLYETARSTLETWAKATAEKVGAGDYDSQHCLREFESIVILMEDHFSRYDYFLGERPSLPDFTLYGALHAHLLFDPTPRSLLQQKAPALVRFYNRMHKARASDHKRHWPSTQGMPPTLNAFLMEISTRFHLFLRKNHDAIQAGEDMVLIDFGYGDRNFAVRKYVEKCRLQIEGEIWALAEEERVAVKNYIDTVGCWDAFDMWNAG